jgi:MFS family permease
MSTTSPPTTGSTPDRARPADWLRALGPDGRRAFGGAFGGYALDAYDFQVLPLAIAAIAVSFHLTSGAAGLLSSVTLVVSAVGGAVAGMLADRIGRVRALMITVGTYALFTLLCGLAPNYPILLVLRAFQGLGFGGEWAIGAVLVAEYAPPRFRGRTLGFVQSSWAVGWGLAVAVQALVFTLAPAGLAWRLLFVTGALPALLVLYLRRSVTDAPRPAADTPAAPSPAAEKPAAQGPAIPSPAAAETGEPARAAAGSFRALFRGDLLRTTLFAALFATGVQGGYYTLATWLPQFLKAARHLSVTTSGGYLAVTIGGAFLGYVTGGYLTDLLGRKRAFALFAVLSAALIIVYTRVPAGGNTAVLALGFPLGFCSSAIYSGFGSFLAELYPAHLRATGQGFTYNIGRGIGAFLPAVVGFLADRSGIAAAMTFGALGYAVAVAALVGLPETRGRELR